MAFTTASRSKNLIGFGFIIYLIYLSMWLKSILHVLPGKIEEIFFNKFNLLKVRCILLKILLQFLLVINLLKYYFVHPEVPCVPVSENQVMIKPDYKPSVVTFRLSEENGNKNSLTVAV